MPAGDTPDTGVLETDVCVVGGGPAGLALALGLVRRGVRTTVLERSTGGQRELRGESLSPDSVRLLDRFGVLERLRADALTVHRLEVADAGRPVLSIDFARFPYAYRHPMEIPQPRLLAELTTAAAREPGFRLLPGRTATGLWREAGRVVGVRAAGPGGPLRVRAALTAVAEGRFGRLREEAGLPATVRPLRRDVLWLRLPRPAAWTEPAYRIRIHRDRHALVLPDANGSTVRVGFSLPKRGLRALRAAGITTLHERLRELVPELADRPEALPGDWSQTALLDIFTADVPVWHAPGAVLLGDAAHTLSPVLGQGVNHALGDAAVLAPLVAGALGDSRPGRARAVDAATAAYQRGRARAVADSHRLQCRQERVFTWSSRPAAAARRTVYRALQTSPRLRARVLEPAYFAAQRGERADRAHEEERT
ncbi:FAD-dependent oxidoreductase [Streptomyces sp. NPDC049577]|uniref:FAD-dependent oxidoreductase n=1 Tax=Streptomyces sp. NPDC049577 TaxID=3155153 RepID=UPI0034269331